MRRFAPFVVALALIGCSSAPPKDAVRDFPESFHEIAEQAASSLAATERFKSDVLDVRGIMDRTGAGVATGDLERELRDALAHHGLHVIARADPKPSERAAVAIQVYGLVDAIDGDAHRYGLVTHLETAVESPTSAGPSRVVWSFQGTFGGPSRTQDVWVPGSIDMVAMEAHLQLAASLRGADAVQVIPVADRTSKFPVLLFDACLRHHLVAEGKIPVVWRRSAGIDAPIGMGAATSPEKRADLPSIIGEVTEAPGGGSILTLKLERVNAATKKLEIVAQFDRKLP